MSRLKRKKQIHALIRCVIFDLDDTLYDCFGQRVRAAHHHAAQAMVEAGLKATPDAVYRAAREAYFNCPVGKLTLFRGSLPLLRFLAKRGVRNFIVSFGEPKTQHAKVKLLGLGREPSVEKIYYADRGNVLTKEAAFR